MEKKTIQELQPLKESVMTDQERAIKYLKRWVLASAYYPSNKLLRQLSVETQLLLQDLQNPSRFRHPVPKHSEMPTSQQSDQSTHNPP